MVVPTFRGRDHLPECLRSLAGQTLDRSRYEIIVVLNGPDDGSRDFAGEFRDRHPGLRLRLVTLPVPGASRARNAGIAAASEPFTAFVDDDDTVSPGYLEALLAGAGPDVVSFARLVDVEPDGRTRPTNAIMEQTIPHAGRTVHPDLVPRTLGFNACKLVPTELVRTVRYDPALESGVDVVFYMTLLAHHDFRISVCPPEADAIYYRLLRPASMSRREEGFEFSVVGRLEVISRIDPLLRLCDESRRRVLMTTMRAQAGFIQRYLLTHPDQRERVLAAVDTYGMTAFPHEVLVSPAASAR